MGIDSGRVAGPRSGSVRSRPAGAADLERRVGIGCRPGKPSRRVRQRTVPGGGSPGFRRGGRRREAPARAHHGARRGRAALQRLRSVVRGRGSGGAGSHALPRRAPPRRATGRSAGLWQARTPRRARAATHTSGGHPRASVRRDRRPVIVRLEEPVVFPGYLNDADAVGCRQVPVGHLELQHGTRAHAAR